MDINLFMEELKKGGISTITGIPDSALKPFCDYMNSNKEKYFEHYVPANEGAAVGIAIGSYLTTGKPSCVYMQNSGLGNIINPLTSLANENVYDIPMLFLIGWRGDPTKKDEPQHAFMGKITEEILSVLNIKYSIICEETTHEEIIEIFNEAKKHLSNYKQYAILVKQGTFQANKKNLYVNNNLLIREEAIKTIIESISENDLIITTTGKISREVYEQCDIIHGHHSQCFLTVGGMGHASMIAYSIAKNYHRGKVYCIEGDGALLMHMGNMAIIGEENLSNLIHICLNNEAHESVGGMPTGAKPSFCKVAKILGYNNSILLVQEDELADALEKSKDNKGTTFMEIMVAMDSRETLIRPKESPVTNKINFINFINSLE